MLYTSYYGNIKNLLKSGFKLEQLIGISLSNFDNIFVEKKLCVRSVDFFNYKYNKVIDWKIYRRNYLDKLYNLEKIWLDNIFDEYDGCVFLCYEKDNKYCHRKILMDFLNWYYVNCRGFSVSERGVGVICKEFK